MVMRKRKFLQILAASACTGILAPLCAHAGGYPDAPIRLVVPFSAGGGVDIVGRILAKKLNHVLGQNVIVENKPGASGMLGAATVARARPNGLTILLASSGEAAINPYLYKHMAYDPAKDLAPITLVAKIPNVLAVNTAVPASNAAELVKYLKTQPNTTYSSSGIGNIQDISGDLFNQLAGTHVRGIPYKGSAQQIADVAAKRVTMTFASAAAMLPFIRSKRVRPIAVTSTTPLAALPKLPPLADTPGFKSFDLVNWFGLFAPAGTPPAIIATLNAAAVKALKDPEVVKTLELQGAIPAPMASAQFKTFRDDQAAMFGKLIKDAGIAKR